MGTKLNKRQRWMSAFEDECLKAGVDYEVIHGPGHETFWCSANYYFTQGVAVPDAVRRFKEAAAHIRGNVSEAQNHRHAMEDAFGTHGQGG